MKRNRMDSHQWDSALDPEVVPLFLHLQWAQARSLQEMRPVLLRHGLSVAEFDVLATLRNAPAPYEMTPSQMLEVTMQCHQFLFQSQLTSNVANRTSDGVQQLFRQQS